MTKLGAIIVDNAQETINVLMRLMVVTSFQKVKSVQIIKRDASVRIKARSTEIVK